MWPIANWEQRYATPDTSSGTALTPPGLGLSLGSPADVSSAAVAAPAPPPSSDGATPDGTAAATAGRPDTGRMPALGGPRTAWPAEVPRATSMGPPPCRHPGQVTPTGDRYLSDSTRAAQQLELGSEPRSGAPCDAGAAAETDDEAQLASWVVQAPASAILPTSSVPQPSPISSHTLGSPRLCSKLQCAGARETNAWRWVYAPIWTRDAHGAVEDSRRARLLRSRSGCWHPLD